MELKHYGVKGMKWGQNVMAQEYIPIGKRPNGKPSAAMTTRPAIPSNIAINRHRPMNPAFQLAQSKPKQVKVVGTTPDGKKKVVVQKKQASNKEADSKLKKDAPAEEASSAKKKRTATKVKKDTAKTNDLDKMALKVIRGDYGNGEERKKALGDEYAKIQARVNELLKVEGVSDNTKQSTKKKTKKIRKGGKTATKAEQKTNREGNDKAIRQRSDTYKETVKKQAQALERDTERFLRAKMKTGEITGKSAEEIKKIASENKKNYETDSAYRSEINWRNRKRARELKRKGNRTQ